VSRLVLITGGAGFIGANLVRRLVAKGDEVRVFDALLAGHVEYLPEDVPVIRGDVRDPKALLAAAADADAIVHLAAHASVPGSIADPRMDFEANVAGTFNILEAARAAQAHVVFASSNATTGGAAPISRPDAPLRPVAPYGAAKASGEVYGHAFQLAYGLPFTALRFSNVYGPFSLHKTSVVAAFVRQTLTGRPITINGDGRQTRDFVHVDDLVGGIVAALATLPDAPRLVQIGSGVETSVLELVDALERATGGSLTRVHGPTRPGDVSHNVSDIASARAELGYEPKIGLADGIAATVRWFEAAMRDPRLAGISPHGSGSE
jgi:UDP-glucose 4-epimerase